jgi:hypothetical protein
VVGRVFISCGQRESERATAEKIRNLLRENFSLDSYLAFKVQGLMDIMKITDELKASDYYLFVDFLREGKDDIPCSLFTHQELALAHHVGFRDIIAIQQDGAPLEGFLKYVLSNPEHFSSEEDLLQKVNLLVRERGWNKNFSRNLVLEEVKKVENALTYIDHTGERTEFVWQAKVVNRRPDVAAVNAVCILDSIVHPDGSTHRSNDRSYLKWAGVLQGYNRTILPEDSALLDVFCIRGDRSGLFLHSALDTMRLPVLETNGIYKLNYKLFSEGFPLLPFSVEVIFHTSDINTFWQNPTEAHLLA